MHSFSRIKLIFRDSVELPWFVMIKLVYTCILLSAQTLQQMTLLAMMDSLGVREATVFRDETCCTV